MDKHITAKYLYDFVIIVFILFAVGCSSDKDKNVTMITSNTQTAITESIMQTDEPIEEIIVSVPKPILLEARNFSDGLAAVKTNDGWGYINTEMEFVVPPQYPQVGDFYNGKAMVYCYGEPHFRPCIIDKNGNVTCDLSEWDEVGLLSEGFAWVKKVTDTYDKSYTEYGYINDSGEIIVPLSSERAIRDKVQNNFKNGFAYWNSTDTDKRKDGNFKYILNTKGKEIAEFQVSDFWGSFTVKTGDDMGLYIIGGYMSLKASYIDSEGKEFDPNPFLLETKSMGNFSEGIIPCYDYNSNSGKYDKIRYVNTKGETILNLSEKLKLEDSYIYYVGDVHESLSLIIIRNNMNSEFFTYVDINTGNFIFEPIKFKAKDVMERWNAGNFSEGLAPVTIIDTSTGSFIEQGYIDKTGKFVISLGSPYIKSSYGITPLGDFNNGFALLNQKQFINTSGEIVY